MITLTTFFLQMDELWSYLRKKRKQLWVFVGLEVETRFWINLYDYNYRRYHKSLRLPVVGQKTLRFKKRWMHQTPAMAMGATQEAINMAIFIFVTV